MGRITPEKFVEEVNKLRFQDKDGAWWQIEVESGDWLRWDGSGWQKAGNDQTGLKSGSGPRKHAGAKSQVQGGSHQTDSQAAQASELSGIISISWTSLLRQIVGSLFGRLRLMITVALIAFLLHTFLIAVGNNGYDKDLRISSMFSQLRAYSPRIFSGQLPWFINWTVGDFKVGSNIAIKRNEKEATAGWTLGGALLLLGWRGFRRNGVFGSLRRFLSMPKQIAASCGPHMGVNLAGLAFGVIVANYFSDKLPHQSQNMLSFLSLGLVGSMIPLAFAGVLARLGNLIASAMKFKILQKIRYAGLSQVIFMGLSCGMFAKSVWQYGPYVGWGLAIYTIFLIIARPGKAVLVSNRVSLFLNLTAVIGLISFLTEEAAFAHDKGWWENVNSNDPLSQQIVSWVKAPGSTELMQAGVPPSIGAALGAGAVDAATDATTYVLQVNTHSMQVSPESPGELLVAVWKTENGGPLVPAGDASISIMGSAPWLSLSQTSGVCRVNCLVGQKADSMQNSTMPESVILTVVGSGGGQSCTSTVSVAPGGQPQYVLEVF
jgi:hypothetical protein